MKMPLYLKIRNHIFDKLQVMDAPTLAWLKKRLEFNETKILEIKKAFKPLNKDIFLKFIPPPDWFINSSRVLSIHGESHALRVMIFAYIICNLGKIKNYEKYLISSSIHDVSRTSDTDDPNHGERVSQWFLRISMAVKYHDTDYNLIPRDILLKFGSMINVLKCADALDRFRLPKENWFPKKEFLKINLPDSLFDLSKKLVYETENLIINKNFTPSAAVIQINSELDLIT